MKVKEERKTTIYCVTVDFYDSGKFTACMTSQELKKKPKSHFKQQPGMSTFKIWLVSESTAIQLLESIKTSEVDLDDFFYFYSNIKGMENG